MLTAEQRTPRKPARATSRRKTGQAKALRPSHFAQVYQADLMERIAFIRKGISPTELVRTSKAMRLPQEHIYKMLRLPASTTKRKLALNALFSPEQSERILGLQRLIGQVEVMVAESGADAKSFDAAAWVARWLDEASPALSNKRPGEFMDTVAGQEIVSNLLAKMQSGAYA